MPPPNAPAPASPRPRSGARRWRPLVALVVVLLLVGAAPLPGSPGAGELHEARLALAEARAEVAVLTGDPRAEATAMVGALERQRAALARLERVQDRVRVSHPLSRLAVQVRGVLAPSTTSTGALAWPADGVLTSGFGPRALPDFDDTNIHEGIDIAALPGTPVTASAAGTVSFAGYLPESGNTVIIDHDRVADARVWTVYSHLDHLAVRDGEVVEAGAPLGGMGSTGELTTGPHLHFEVHVQGVPVDPLAWLGR